MSTRSIKTCDAWGCRTSEDPEFPEYWLRSTFHIMGVHGNRKLGRFAG